MKRRELLEEILCQFEVEAKAFCEKNKGLGCKIRSKYKKEETVENLKYRYAKIDFSEYSINFKYTAHSLMNLTNSILEAFVSFDSGDEAVLIPLQFVTDYYGFDTLLPLSVPFISNKEGMKQAFGRVSAVIEKLNKRIEETSKDIFKRKDILVYFENEFRTLFELKDSEISFGEFESEHYYSYLTFRFTSSAYINILKGKKEKALSQLEKPKIKTSYEKRLINLLKNDVDAEACDISYIVENASLYNDKGIIKTSFKEIFSIFVASLVAGALISPLYFGFFYAFIGLESRNSIYLAGPSYSFYLCFIGAFITGIALSYFTRYAFYNLMFKKSFKRLFEMDAIENSVSTDKLMKRFVFLCFAFVVGMLFFVVKWNLNFTETGFIDNTKFFDVKGVFYEYEEIEEIYYKENRVNDFGETLDYPSYVIVLKDGKEIDLFDYEDTAVSEEKLIPILEGKGIRIKRGDEK